MQENKRHLKPEINFISALSTTLGALFAFHGTLNAAQILHDWLVHNLLRLPMSFFDITPKGRILQRCAKDIDILDYTMAFILRHWFTMLTGVRTYDEC
jgi:ABC-type multidrug transport system fused ATPase/permease subunit